MSTCSSKATKSTWQGQIVQENSPWLRPTWQESMIAPLTCQTRLPGAERRLLLSVWCHAPGITVEDLTSASSNWKRVGHVDKGDSLTTLKHPGMYFYVTTWHFGLWANSVLWLRKSSMWFGSSKQLKICSSWSRKQGQSRSKSSIKIF